MKLNIIKQSLILKKIQKNLFKENYKPPIAFIPTCNDRIKHIQNSINNCIIFLVISNNDSMILSVGDIEM